jgi:TrmH family RNA methyltransferase
VLRVSSPHNPRLREVLRLLGSARERRKTGRCVLEGAHLVQVYRARLGDPELLIVTDDALARDEVAALANAIAPSRVLAAPVSLLAEHTALPPEVGVLAVVPTPRASARVDAAFTLLLEDVQDPGNVGSMLRSAAAAGCEQVLLSPTCAFAWSPKVLRAAQGAHFLTCIAENVDLAAWLMRFREHGRAVASVAHGGEDVFSTPLAPPLAIAIGNEGSGLSEALVDACDARVTIPLAPGSESLNAAAAAAVMLFQVVKAQGPARGPCRGVP